jgi:hypothetical protein
MIEASQDHFQVKLTFVELYNNNFVDLLDPQNDPAARVNNGKAATDKISIREYGNNIVLEGSPYLRMP